MKNLTKSKEFYKRSKQVLAGPSTFSKGPDQFAYGISPYALDRGDGAYVWAKPEQLSALTTWVAKEALTRASARVAPAIEEALAYSPRAKPKKRSRKEEQEAEEAPESPTKKKDEEDDLYER